MSRIDTALNPLVENRISAAPRIASRMFGLRVMVCLAPFVLYVCTKDKVKVNETLVIVKNFNPLTGKSIQKNMARKRQIIIAVQALAWLLRAGSLSAHWPGHAPATSPRAS